MMHQEEFGIHAEWHFTATSHGKSTCDAISGTVKDTTRRGSLKEKKYIVTPEEMFVYCKEKLSSPTLQFIYVDKGLVLQEKERLLQRYKHFKQIPGTRHYHSFRPNGEAIVLKEFSSSLNFVSFYFKRAEITLIPFEQLVIERFYCFVAAEKVQVGILEEKDSEEQDVTLQMMKLNRRTGVLTWPHPAICISAPLRDVLSVLEDPETKDGINFKLPNDGFNRIKDLQKNLPKSSCVGSK